MVKSTDECRKAAHKEVGTDVEQARGCDASRGHVETETTAQRDPEAGAHAAFLRYLGFGLGARGSHQLCEPRIFCGGITDWALL